MFHGGLFGDPAGSSEPDDVERDEPEVDTSPDLGSAFGMAGNIISDPFGTSSAVEESVTGSAEPDTDDAPASSADARRQFRQIEQEADTGPAAEPSDDGGSSGGGGVVRTLAGFAQEAGETAGEAVADFTGATEASQSETAQELREERREARQEGGIMGRLKEFDVATRAGVDFLLDNPQLSVQDSAREGIEAATGVESEDQGEAAAEIGQQFNRVVQAGQQEAGEALEGTALDNPVTDAVVAGGEFLGEAVVADPAKAAVRGTTGIDVDEGDEEGTVGVIDVFDIGVTLGTAGLGKAGFTAARGALRGSDEAAGAVGRILGRSGDEAVAATDEAAQATDGGVRVLDETTASSTDELLPVLADDAAQTGDDLLPRLADEGAAGADDVARSADEAGSGARSALFGSVAAGAARSADEAARVGDSVAGRLGRFVDELTGGADEGARLADEAAAGSDDAARLADEGAQLSDEGARLTDEAAQLSDEAAQVGDESIGILQRITGSSLLRIGGAVTAGTVAGGALLDTLGTFDEMPVTDNQGNEYLLIREKDYPQTEQRGGGILWRVEQQGETGSLGYTVMVGAQGRNVYILDQDGNRIRAQVDMETFREAIQRARGAPPGAGQGVA